MSIELDTSLAFDQNKQSAIVGWCLLDDLFAKQCAMVVKKEWFSSPTVAKIYEAILSVRGTYHRRPTKEEIVSYRPFTREEAAVQKRIPEILAECAKATQSYGLDMLRQEMTKWMQAVIFSQIANRGVDTFNAQKVEEAWSILEQGVLMKQTSSFEEGINQGFRDSKDRIVEERAERIEQAKRILRFGVKFLDDNLIGITPNDLIVLGAKTGAGKTQLAMSIAKFNALKGYPVHYFALEAEENEIERRIKFGIISEAYNYSKDINDPYIGYAEWRMGVVGETWEKLEASLEDRCQKAVKNLHTLYRTSGSFDLKALEQSLMEVVGRSRLIVIDHLHYIDTGEDENHDYKQTIKMIRDIVLRFGVPIIVIAHLRKGTAKLDQLIPGVEEFHGTSDVPKIATTAIMLSPDFNPEHHLLDKDKRNYMPTFMGAVKSRLDGARTRYVALTHFNPYSGRYEDEYALSFNAKYDPLWGPNVPYWAKDMVRPKTIDFGAARDTAGKSDPDLQRLDE
jgi:replicative DNA helicase